MSDLNDEAHKPRNAPAEYTTVPVRSVLRPSQAEDGHWQLALNPYEGCELGCTFCSARLDRKDAQSWTRFQTRIAAKANAAEVLRRELASREYRERPIALGTVTEAWQPLEERLRITRSLLEVLAEHEDVDLRIYTRSSLIARDTDVLKRISERGQVTVAFSIAAADERITRLLEPRAPSPVRRLAAMEGLARAGIAVGLLVSPVFPGLDETELGLDALLARATHAGARFAALKWMAPTPAQREVFLEQVTRAFPDSATRFRRILGFKAATASDQAALTAAFQLGCEKYRLHPLTAPVAPRTELHPARRRPGPTQLALFDA